MALTKVSGPLLHGSNDNLGNYVINNITGAAATFTGNVSVGGTLTYDDVTNVESVGIVTAKGGLHVGAGGTIIHALSEDNGKVGIGTDNPTRLLSIEGNINLASGSKIESYSSGGNLQIQGGSTYPGGHIKLYGGSGDDMITFNTSGASISSTERLRIGSTGISTFTNDVRIVKSGGPLLELTTNTGAADATLRLSEGTAGSTTNGGGMFYSGADNKLHITCGTDSTTKRITILRDDGNVGIGTADPYYNLQVNFNSSTTALSGGTSGNWGGAGLRLENDNTTAGAMSLVHFRVHDTDWHIGNKYVTSNKSDFIFNHEGSEKLRIDSNGRVGINSTSPTGDLDVVGSVGTAATIFVNAPVHNTNVASISMLKLGYRHSGGQAVGYLKLIEGGGNAFDGSLRFGVPYNLGGGNFGTRDDVVTINHSGRVGIGSTIPSNTLVVREQTDNNPSIQLFRPSTGGDIANIIWATNSGNQAQINYRGGSGSEGLQFYTGGTGSSNLRAIIDTDGKIGIGTHDPQAPVHIDGGTTGTQRLRVQNHQSVGSFSGNYGSEFRHATSGANHCMLVHCEEANDDRRTLDISDSNGVFAQFVNGKFGVGTAGNDAGHPTRDVEICSPDGGILRISSSDDSLAGNERIGAIEFHTDDDDGGHVSCAITAIADPSDNFGRRGALIFGTQNSDSPPGDAIERVRINASGLVGVGNTAPEGKGIDIQHSRTNAYSRTGDNRGLAHLIVRNSSDAPDRFSSISWVSGGGTQAEGSINLIQTGSYTGDFAIKLRNGSGSSDWRERLRITSGGVVHQSGATDESTWSRQTGRAQQGDGVAVTYSIKTFYYGTATFRIGLSDGNYKWATLVVEIGGHQYASGNGYNATVVSNSTGNGPSISLNKQDGGYHITITNGGNSNTLFGSWVLEGTSYSNLSKPTLVLS